MKRCAKKGRPPTAESGQDDRVYAPPPETQCTHTVSHCSINSEQLQTDQTQTEQSQTVTDVLATPVTQPLSLVEQKLLAALLRHLGHQHQSQFGLPVYRGGRPLHISFTSASNTSGAAQGQ